MSWRSLLEFNHDYCPRDTGVSTFGAELQSYMRSGDSRELPDGVTLKWSRHHSAPEPTPDDLAGRRVAQLAAIIVPLLADGRTAGRDGGPRIGRATRAKAVRIAAAIVDAEMMEASDAR